MAIFNDLYPLDMYDKSIPEDLKELSPAVCAVAAVGQNILSKSGFVLKTTGYYYNVEDPRYPNGGEGKLCSTIADESAVWMTGTAFAISRNRFITAKHVVEDILNEVDSKNLKDLRIISGYYRKSSPSSSFSYTVLNVNSIELDKEYDLAVINTSNSLPSSVKPLSLSKSKEENEMKINDRIYIMGYPLGQPLKFSEGTICEIDTSEPKSFKGWISSFAGNSGSPVINTKSGNVIGIMVSGSTQSDWSLNTTAGCYGYAKFPNDNDHYAGFLFSDNLNI